MAERRAKPPELTATSSARQPDNARFPEPALGIAQSGAWRFFVVGFAAVFASCLLILPVLGSNVWFSWDSAIVVARASEYLQLPFSVSLQSNFVDGLFGFPFPMNFQLLPEYQLSFRDGKLSPVVFFLMASLLVYSSCFAMARTFGFRSFDAMWSGLSFILLCMPVSATPLYSSEFWWTGPQWLPMAYGFPALLMTFYWAGRSNNVAISLFCSASFIALSLWMCASITKAVVPVMFGLGWFALAFVFVARSLKEASWKIGTLLVLGTIFVYFGPLDFFRGMAGFSKNSLLVPELQTTNAADLLHSLHYLLDYVSFAGIGVLAYLPTWLAGVVGYPLLLGTAAGVVCAWRQRRTNPAIWHLALPSVLAIVASLVGAYGFVTFGALYPVMILLSVFGVATLARGNGVHGARAGLASFTSRFIGRASNVVALRLLPAQVEAIKGLQFTNIAPHWPLASGVILVAGIAALTIAAHRAVLPAGFPYPPAMPAILEAIKENIELRDGRQFRGQFANLAFVSHEPATNSSRENKTIAAAIVDTAASTAIRIGNDLIFPGLLFYRIPYLFEYNRVGSPTSMIFFRYLLDQRDESNRIDFNIVTRFVPRLFELLGVRYILAERPLQSPELSLVGAVQVDQKAKWPLYAVTNSDHGNWSPVEVQITPYYRAVLRSLEDPAFDPRSRAILSNSWADVSALVPATTGSIAQVPNGLRIRGASAGKSLLVLPVEYSACLRVDNSSRMAPLAIGRIDFLLTGVLFQEDTDFTLTFRTGLFENSGVGCAICRSFPTWGLHRMISAILYAASSATRIRSSALCSPFGT